MATDRNSKWLTLPNAITALRMLGSPGMVALAAIDRPYALAGFTVFLVFTEWLDGFLARRLHVTSVIGARLDTVADAIFYSCLLASIVVLRPVLVLGELAWIVAAVVSYWLSWLASWIKFRRLPSYHTWSAKGVWGVVGVGTVWLLADRGPWPFRAAMVCVVLTNLEAIAITWILPTCQVDVPTFWHARRERARRHDGHSPGEH